MCHELTGRTWERIATEAEETEPEDDPAADMTEREPAEVELVTDGGAE
jgi:hypothetical protein